MKNIDKLTSEKIAKLCLGYLHIKKELYCERKEDVVNGRQHIVVDCPTYSGRHCWKCLEKWLNSEVEE